MRDLRVLAALAPIALGLGTVAVATPALADDPNDPSMASLSARERDRAIIRKLNRDQLAYVRERDARYAEGWAEYREAQGDDRRAGRSRGSSSYAAARREYENELAQWREDVVACRAGYYEHCSRD